MLDGERAVHPGIMVHCGVRQTFVSVAVAGTVKRTEWLQP
jgi:hypothetical protein